MNYQELLSSVSCQKIFDEPMSKHTTFAIGGKADVFLTPKNETELLQLLEIAKKNNIPFVLSSSIRDDGPLPEVIHDAYVVCEYSGENQ